jgi:Fe2+ transport system protein FeoA
LADLGLYIGMRVRIVQDDLSGPVILAVKNDSRVAVGRGMAQKILVTHAEEQR